jgi:hypothetical protein
VARVPEARVRPLRVEGARVELPLWWMPGRVGRARRAVWSDELAALKVDELAPRALAMTALVRKELCDLFIHGTGGGVYDRITDLWLGEWLGGGALAPTAVVTATRHLPFDVRVRRPEEIARASELFEQHAALTANVARLQDHLGGAPNNEQYKQELLHAENELAKVKAELGID